MKAKHAIWEKRLYLKEHIFSMFMNVLSTKRLRECKAPYMEKQNDLTKTCIFGVFELVMYQNAKTHAKHPLWGNRTTLSKNVCLESF